MGDFDLGLIPFSTQIEEWPAIKEILLKAPRNPAYLVDPGKTWKVYAQPHEGDRWRAKAFSTYREAFAVFKKRRASDHDVSITSTRLKFLPPSRVVKITRRGKPLMVKTARGKLIQQTRIVYISPPPGHSWCMYCRRFTVFLWFSQHHAIPKEFNYSLGEARRCCICGVREVMGTWRGR